MTTFKIILDAGKLNSAITAVLKAYNNVHQQLHVIGVSCLHHAAVFGQPAPLNRFFNGLATNDKTAFRNYVGRIHALIGLNSKTGKLDAMDRQEVIKAKADGQVLTYSVDNGFGVLKNDANPNVKDNKAKLAKMCEDKLINPDEKDGWTTFLARNNLAEIRTLGDAEITAQIKRLVTQVKGDSNSDRIKINVSPKFKKALFTMYDNLESISEQTDDKPGAELVKAKDVKRPNRGRKPTTTPANDPGLIGQEQANA